jgi:hypothetical protein
MKTLVDGRDDLLGPAGELVVRLRPLIASPSPTGRRRPGDPDYQQGPSRQPPHPPTAKCGFFPGDVRATSSFAFAAARPSDNPPHALLHRQRSLPAEGFQPKLGEPSGYSRRRMPSGEFGSAAHLAGRFFTALWPGGPSAEGEAWAKAMLLPGEELLWERMSGPDRRHGVAVARRAIKALEGGAAPVPREVAAAALLHDVGKIEARLGTFARVAVTLAAMAAGRRRLVRAGQTKGDQRPGRVDGSRGWRQRAAVYLSHDQVGALLLREAGSDDFTSDWARQHHMKPEAWTLEAGIAHVLKAADGD